ncbi:hypothetical protein [Blastococcus deserti]|uniref:Uncharacterized protein n=1 Tax=Blastococcus deserti TaxID=2259033 RepID=A0ABW4XCF5_9ACTN
MDEEPATSWIALGGCVVAAALAFVACSAGGSTVCPAIGWSNALVVELADDWSRLEGGSLRIECSSRCGYLIHEDGPSTDEDALTVPLGRGREVFQLDMTAPDAVVVTVLAADGTELAEVDADLDWHRVGGSEDCGGPHEATVVVPAA